MLNVESEEPGGVSRSLCRLGRFFDSLPNGGADVDTDPIFEAIASFSCDYIDFPKTMNPS